MRMFPNGDLLMELEPDTDGEPDYDDSVQMCPECETPNQFGELCPPCQREQDRINACEDRFDRDHSLNEYGE